MRLPTIQDDELDALSYTVQALAPSQDLPYGCCDCVLVHDGASAEHTGVDGA